MLAGVDVNFQFNGFNPNDAFEGMKLRTNGVKLIVSRIWSEFSSQLRIFLA